MADNSCNDVDLNLVKFIVKSVPATCFYVPEFITEAEENLLIHNIEKTSALRWTQLKNRRLINYGGIPTQKGMIAEEIPAYLQAYLKKVNDLKVFGDVSANHILLNEYKAGQGIMPHFDGPLFYPTITTISVGSQTVLEFHQSRLDDAPSSSTPDFKLLVAPRSLLVLKNDLYHRFMHSISEIKDDDLTDPLIKNLKANSPSSIARTTRFSLTIRNVPKTSKMKLKFGK